MGRMALMRFLMVAAGVLQASISAEAKLVWAAIYFLARPTGICAVSYQQIGALVALDKRAVMRVIPELTDRGFIVSSGGGNGRTRSFIVPVELVQNSERFNFDTGAETEPVEKQDRSRNGTGPLLKLNRTATESAPPYKEEINNNNKSASGDAEQPLSLLELQQRWFDEEFWPRFWGKRDKAEALKAFKRHAVTETKKNQIITALNSELADMQARQPKHRPYAATWLNKRRYEDEFASPENSDAAQGSHAHPEWMPWEEPPTSA